MCKKCVLCVLFVGVAAVAWAGPEGYPPLTTEISPDHPLFMFEMSGFNMAEPAEYADSVMRAWGRLPDTLKPFSAVQVDMTGSTVDARHARYRELLEVLAQAEVATVIRVADADPRRVYPVDRIEELVRDFTFIKGIQAVDLRFDEYDSFGEAWGPVEQPVAQWLGQAIEAAARYGRFTAIELGQVHWARVMSNASCGPLYERIRDCRGYVLPIASFQDAHTIPQQSALMGLWLEGAAEFWGIGPSSEWYRNVGFLEPGVVGRDGAPGAMPPELYRAMILRGVMAGATAYSFRPGADLWFGERREHWERAIEPTLEEIANDGLVARKRFVLEKVQVAYQLAPARSSLEFHLNLRDIDPVLDEGLLIRGAYGLERLGQVAELIPNTGRYYWIPILSPHAPPGLVEGFARVVQPGTMASPEAWTDLLDRYYRPDGAGTAFISRIGRGIFVLHTCENRFEPQSYRVAKTPAPVRGTKARRTDEGVEVSWPFREGDIEWHVYRRTMPDGALERVAEHVDARNWVDRNVDPEEPVAYSVSAITYEEGVEEGTVNFGDYLTLSGVESSLAEEVVITPLLGYGKGQPIEEQEDAPRPVQSWAPDLEGLTDAQQEAALGIVEQLDAWEQAFVREALDRLTDVYAAGYEDPQGWGPQYVRRAYQWFFERYGACRIQRQIRQWDFSEFEDTGQVGVALYCRLSGVAMTDATGRFADMPAHFPRTTTGLTAIDFVNQEGTWRILRTEPALPNFKDILSFSAGPYDRFTPGADVYGP